MNPQKFYQQLINLGFQRVDGATDGWLAITLNGRTIEVQPTFTGFRGPYKWHWSVPGKVRQGVLPNFNRIEQVQTLLRLFETLDEYRETL